MKKFNAIYKRGNVEKAVVIEVHVNDLFVVTDEKGSKEVKKDTIRRWYTMGSEIVENKIDESYLQELLEKEKEDNQRMFGAEAQISESKAEKKDRKHSRSELKKDGSVRQDKFKPKLNADQAFEILENYAAGVIKAQLARDYQVSYRTITCIIEGLMWKDVFAKFHDQETA